MTIPVLPVLGVLIVGFGLLYLTYKLIYAIYFNIKYRKYYKVNNRAREKAEVVSGLLTCIFWVIIFIIYISEIKFTWI